MIVARTTLETLPVRLTKSELLERGNSLALAREHYTRQRGEAKAAAAVAKADLEEIEGEVDRLAGIVRAKAEPRPVETRVVRDYERGVVDTVRLDTGELVRTRAMTEQERQIRIFDDGEEVVTVEAPQEQLG